MKTSWNPLTWGAESGGYWLVFLVLLAIGLGFFLWWTEKRWEREMDAVEAEWRSLPCGVCGAPAGYSCRRDCPELGE